MSVLLSYNESFEERLIKHDFERLKEDFEEVMPEDCVLLLIVSQARDSYRLKIECSKMGRLLFMKSHWVPLDGLQCQEQIVTEVVQALLQRAPFYHAETLLRRLS